MNIAEMYLRKHPGENAAFDSAPASLHGYMGKKLDFQFADDCRSVYMRYAGTIAMEVYMRGVMDRARPHYAVVSRELPLRLLSDSTAAVWCRFRMAVPELIMEKGWNCCLPVIM